MDELTPEQARAALDVVERSRRRVIDEIDVPRWYWAGLASGWIVLGVIADVHHPLVTTLATLAFGAAHSSIAPRVVNGRHRSSQMSVRGDIAGPRLAAWVLGSLVALVGVTIAAALILNADDAHHPVTGAAVLAAVILVLGGPLLPAAARRRAVRTGAAS
ncbi:hypothetical protein P2Q00_49855 [Streptomyces coacervatus]|uniref:hypothetical protein n=1 Tax=Streptomyces coacervatus TaxID=647381 RepID=UPI0023DA31CE|nr:hypothetical protein [Streptomyces coacervatus]MDF2273438.1 hypothetical protein [Streptomyces coacervatus]